MKQVGDCWLRQQVKWSREFEPRGRASLAQACYASIRRFPREFGFRSPTKYEWGVGEAAAAHWASFQEPYQSVPATRLATRATRAMTAKYREGQDV